MEGVIRGNGIIGGGLCKVWVGGGGKGDVDFEGFVWVGYRMGIGGGINV